MENSISKNILVVDDDESIRSLCEEVLTVAGYRVSTAVHGLHGLELLKQSEYDLVISDVNMPELGGIDFYVSALKMYPMMKNRFVFISGNFSPDIESVINELEIKCIFKPFRISDLLGFVDCAMSSSGERIRLQTGKRQEGRFALTAACEIFEDGAGQRYVKAMADNVSCLGIKAVYKGGPISTDTRVSVYISLNELKVHRSAVVIWSAEVDAETSASGLRFDEPMPVELIINTLPARSN